MQIMKLVTTLLCVSLILGVTFASPLPRRAWKPSNPRESRRKVTDDITQDGSKTNETVTEQVLVNDATTTTTTVVPLTVSSTSVTKEEVETTSEVNQPLELIKNAEAAGDHVKQVALPSSDLVTKASDSDSKPVSTSSDSNVKDVSTTTVSSLSEKVIVESEKAKAAELVTSNEFTFIKVSESTTAVPMVDPSSETSVASSEKQTSELVTSTESSTTKGSESTPSVSTVVTTKKESEVLIVTSEKTTSTEVTTSTTTKKPETTTSKPTVNTSDSDSDEDSDSDSGEVSFAKLAHLIRTDVIIPKLPEKEIIVSVIVPSTEKPTDEMSSSTTTTTEKAFVKEEKVEPKLDTTDPVALSVLKHVLKHSVEKRDLEGLVEVKKTDNVNEKLVEKQVDVHVPVLSTEDTTTSEPKASDKTTTHSSTASLEAHVEVKKTGTVDIKVVEPTSETKVGEHLLVSSTETPKEMTSSLTSTESPKETTANLASKASEATTVPSVVSSTEHVELKKTVEVEFKPVETSSEQKSDVYVLVSSTETPKVASTELASKAAEEATTVSTVLSSTALEEKVEVKKSDNIDIAKKSDVPISSTETPNATSSKLESKAAEKTTTDSAVLSTTALEDHVEIKKSDNVVVKQVETSSEQKPDVLVPVSSTETPKEATTVPATKASEDTTTHYVASTTTAVEKKVEVKKSDNVDTEKKSDVPVSSTETPKETTTELASKASESTTTVSTTTETKSVETTTEKVFVIQAIKVTEGSLDFLSTVVTTSPATEAPRSIAEETSGFNFLSKIAENLASSVANLFTPRAADKVVVSETVSVTKVVKNNPPVEAKDVIIKKPVDILSTTLEPKTEVTKKEPEATTLVASSSSETTEEPKTSSVAQETTTEKHEDAKTSNEVQDATTENLKVVETVIVPTSTTTPKETSVLTSTETNKESSTTDKEVVNTSTNAPESTTVTTESVETKTTESTVTTEATTESVLVKTTTVLPTTEKVTTEESTTSKKFLRNLEEVHIPVHVIVESALKKVVDQFGTTEKATETSVKLETETSKLTTTSEVDSTTVKLTTDVSKETTKVVEATTEASTDTPRTTNEAITSFLSTSTPLATEVASTIKNLEEIVTTSTDPASTVTSTEGPTTVTDVKSTTVANEVVTKSNELRSEIIKAHVGLKLVDRPVVVEDTPNGTLDPVKEYVLITKQIEKIPSAHEVREAKVEVTTAQPSKSSSEPTLVENFKNILVQKVDTIVQDFKLTTEAATTSRTTELEEVDLDTIVTASPAEVIVEIPIPSGVPYGSPPISEEFGRFFSHFN